MDLTRPVDDATAEALRQAFLDHKVLVFRDQHLSPDQHVEAVRIFDQPFTMTCPSRSRSCWRG